MKKERMVNLAYAAGILDGEGCIRITTRNPRSGRSRCYALSVSVVQKDGRVMDWLYGNFGGLVYLASKRKINSWIYEWRICEKQAYEFLKQIRPFLRIKYEQADLAIRFQERRIYARRRILGDTGSRYIALSKHELAERENMYQEMRRLKKQYRKSKHPNVQEWNLPLMVQE